MSYNKFDNLYAGFEHRIIPLFLFMWNSLPSVYIVPDSGDAPLLPTGLRLFSSTLFPT